MINPADARVRDRGIPPLTQFSYNMGLINTVVLEIPKFSTISLQHKHFSFKFNDIQFMIISNLLMIKNQTLIHLSLNATHN